MFVNPAYTAGLGAFRTANEQCMLSCTVTGGKGCTSDCRSGIGDLSAACARAGASLITLQENSTLMDNKGRVLVTTADCAPASCLSQPTVSSLLEDMTSIICGDYSPADVQVCKVSLLGGEVLGAGAVTGIVFAVFAGVLGAGFAAYRFGAVRSDRLPPWLVTVCECGCIKSVMSRTGGGGYSTIGGATAGSGAVAGFATGTSTATLATSGGGGTVSPF